MNNPAPQRLVETDRYIMLLESHIAVLDQRLADQQSSLAALHELNKSLSDKLALAAIPAQRPSRPRRRAAK